MASLKINFFLSGTKFLEKAQILESRLSQLGVVVSNKGRGIGQFNLETELTKEEVRKEMDRLPLGGSITVEEEDDEREMSMA